MGPVYACVWVEDIHGKCCVCVCTNFVSISDYEQGDELLRTFSQMCGTLSKSECV